MNMKRNTISIATVLLALIAGTSCSDAAPSGVHTPPDTTFADGLWTASGTQPGLVRLSLAQLETSASITPATVITSSSASLLGFNSVAFDADGTLWTTSQNDSLLIAFRRTALATSGSRIASRVIASSNGSLSSPSALAFDSSHRLWVANTGNGTIVRFDSVQLASGGTPTPSVILSGIDSPTGLAFDAAGGLWFSQDGSHRVARFAPAQLETSGFILPQVILTSEGPDIGNPVGLAFDAAGNLWIANAGRSNVSALRANHLTTTGLVNADIVISPASAAPSLPLGLAFDAHGNLWVAYAEGVLTEYDHTALAASGAPAPAVRIVINDHQSLRTPAFWPKPAGLPLN
jgi:ligand-binding sensor domain-containing protein